MRAGTCRTLAVVAAALVLLAACGRAGKTAAGGTTGSSRTRGSSVGTAEIPGLGTVLVDAEGFTLYAFTPDQAGAPTCTGGCAATWPPAIVTGTPESAGLPGRLGTVESPTGGMQLTYDGWPLYRYSGDAKPGEANGQGVGGVWFAMTPEGPSQGATTGGMTGGGYGRGGGSGNGGGGRYGP